nr:sodium:proline symporter [Candidatus Sumerlaeota bacterium]
MNPPIPSLQFLDWLVIVGYLFLTIGLGLYFTRRAGRSMDAFFVSGRSLPWYLAGVSMIATSFASDTPLWISSLVRQYGIYYI